MGRLMHLYLPGDILGGMKLGLNCDNLETLTNCDSDSFDMTTLEKLTNLRKLHARVSGGKLEELVAIIKCQSTSLKHLERLSIIVDSGGGSPFRFCSEEELDILKRLLGCQLNELRLDCVIGNLPESHHLSCNLTCLDLKNSKLTEDPMATLEKLPNLRRLGFIQCFLGVEMICSTNGFPQLRNLAIWALTNLERWRVDEGAMRNLLYLTIERCRQLEGVPEGLRFVTTLQGLFIWTMPEAFNERLRAVNGEEGEDFCKVRHVPSIRII